MNNNYQEMMQPLILEARLLEAEELLVLKYGTIRVKERDFFFRQFIGQNLTRMIICYENNWYEVSRWFIDENENLYWHQEPSGQYLKIKLKSYFQEYTNHRHNIDDDSIQIYIHPNVDASIRIPERVMDWIEYVIQETPSVRGSNHLVHEYNSYYHEHGCYPEYDSELMIEAMQVRDEICLEDAEFGIHSTALFEALKRHGDCGTNEWMKATPNCIEIISILLQGKQHGFTIVEEGNECDDSSQYSF